MAKKKIATTTVYSDNCGCAVIMTATGMHLDRCAIHDAGPELSNVLARILDCREDQLSDRLEAAEAYMDELLDAHGGRITADKCELDGIDSYADILKLKHVS